MDSYDVRFWDTKKIADNASGGRYRVRWAVDGREHCKSFKNKTLADGFLDGCSHRRGILLVPPVRCARTAFRNTAHGGLPDGMRQLGVVLVFSFPGAGPDVHHGCWNRRFPGSAPPRRPPLWRRRNGGPRLPMPTGAQAGRQPDPSPARCETCVIAM